MNNSYNSQLLENAVNELSKLPGIGHKTALRLALHLLRQDENIAIALGESIIKMRKENWKKEKNKQTNKPKLWRTAKAQHRGRGL